MKKLLAILLMMPVIAFSQTNAKETVKNIEAECITLQSLDSLLNEFDELPFVRGLSNRQIGTTAIQNPMVLFVNAKTMTWTLMEKTGDGLYCILAVGTTFEPVPAKIIDDIQDKRRKSRS